MKNFLSPVKKSQVFVKASWSLLNNDVYPVQAVSQHQPQHFSSGIPLASTAFEFLIWRKMESKVVSRGTGEAYLNENDQCLDWDRRFCFACLPVPRSLNRLLKWTAPNICTSPCSQDSNCMEQNGDQTAKSYFLFEKSFEEETNSDCSDSHNHAACECHAKCIFEAVAKRQFLWTMLAHDPCIWRMQPSWAWWSWAYTMLEKPSLMHCVVCNGLMFWNAYQVHSLMICNMTSHIHTFEGTLCAFIHY